MTRYLLRVGIFPRSAVSFTLSVKRNERKGFSGLIFKLGAHVCRDCLPQNWHFEQA